MKLFIKYISCIFIIICYSGYNTLIFPQKLDKSSELVQLYQSYRMVQKKKTNWVDTIDNWTGKFHWIMVQLGDTLGKNNYKKKDIIRLMGEPDEIISQNTKNRTAELYYLINSKPIDNIGSCEEYLVYQWRGYRDFLYFLVRKNKVQCSEFYYSWE